MNNRILQLCKAMYYVLKEVDAESHIHINEWEQLVVSFKFEPNGKLRLLVPGLKEVQSIEQ